MQKLWNKFLLRLLQDFLECACVNWERCGSKSRLVGWITTTRYPLGITKHEFRECECVCVCVIVCVCMVCVCSTWRVAMKEKKSFKRQSTHIIRRRPFFLLLQFFVCLCFCFYSFFFCNFLSVCASVSFLCIGYSHPLIRVRHFVRKIIKVILFSDNSKGFSVLYWGKSFTSEGLY